MIKKVKNEFKVIWHMFGGGFCGIMWVWGGLGCFNGPSLMYLGKRCFG